MHISPTPIALMLLLLLALALGIYTSGYQNGYATASRTANQRQLEALQAQALRFKQQLQQANQHVTQLRAEKAAIANTAQTLQERIDYVTTHYKPTPTSPPTKLPSCVFTHGFVSLWNRANGATPVPTVTFAAGADGESTTAGAADTPSNITRADLLTNTLANGSRCQQIAAQLNQLIDYINQNQQRQP